MNCENTLLKLLKYLLIILLSSIGTLIRINIPLIYAQLIGCLIYATSKTLQKQIKNSLNLIFLCICVGFSGSLTSFSSFCFIFYEGLTVSKVSKNNEVTSDGLGSGVVWLDVFVFTFGLCWCFYDFGEFFGRFLWKVLSERKTDDGNNDVDGRVNDREDDVVLDVVTKESESQQDISSKDKAPIEDTPTQESNLLIVTFLTCFIFSIIYFPLIIKFSSLKTILTITLGPLGSLLRYFLSFFNNKYPIGTFIANITSTLIVGVFNYILVKHLNSDSQFEMWRFVVVSGFCGCFSTFSGFVYEIRVLGVLKGVCYAVLSVAVGVLCLVICYYV